MRPLLLELDQLSKRFGKLAALRQLTLELEQGGAVGLLGANGAGKSTLMRLLCGLSSATSGSGRVLGYSLTDGKRRRVIGYMPEGDAFIDGMNGAEQVRFAGELSGLSARRAAPRTHDVLAYVGLGEARHRPLDQYSTGMRQRLKLACALVADPPLLLLDEPASGLDPEGRQRMLALITELTNLHGKQVIFSTHLLPDVERVCERVLVLEAGELVVSKPVRELCGPEHNRWLLRSRESPEILLAALQAAGIAGSLTMAGCVLVEHEGPAAPQRMFAIARAAGLQLRQLEPASTSLEETLLAHLGNTHG
jgi:ABC-2 type transport system ATP-binding protein